MPNANQHTYMISKGPLRVSDLEDLGSDLGPVRWPLAGLRRVQHPVRRGMLWCSWLTEGEIGWAPLGEMINSTQVNPK